MATTGFRWGDGHGATHTRAKRQRPRRPAGPGLTPQQRADNANPLYDPTAQLGGGALRQAAHDLVSTEFDPQQHALERAAGQAQTQGTQLAGNASDYYRQLAADEATGVARRQAIGTELQKRIDATGATAQQQTKAMGDQVQALAGADARFTGTSASPRAAEELAAAGSRATAAQQDASLSGAAEGANYDQLGSLAATATGMQGGETQKRLLQQLAAQMAGYRGQETDLASKRGAAESSAVTKLRQQGFENLVTSEGLGIKRADLQAQTAQDLAANRLAQNRISQADRASQRTNATTRRGQNMTAAQRAADRASREGIAKAKLRYGGRKANEPADARKTKNGIGNAQADISQMLRDGQISPGLRGQIKQVAPGLLGQPMNIDTARKVIVALGAPGIVAQAGAELAKYGGLRTGTASQLRRLGIRLPKGWLGAFAGPLAP